MVTGASRGIGEAIAVRCASRGANVVILAQTTKDNPALPGTIQDAAAACVAAGGDAIAIKTDITDEDQVATAISAAVDRFRGVDVVVNNASTHWPLTGLPSRSCDLRRHDARQPQGRAPRVARVRPTPPSLARLHRRARALRIADADWLKPHVAVTRKIAMGFSAGTAVVSDRTSPATPSGRDTPSPPRRFSS